MQADEHLCSFCLPTLTTCRSDELPNTGEKLVNALAGKFEFEAWHDFDREAATLWQKIQHVLTRREIQEARVYIQALSQMAANPTISSGTLARIDRERYLGAECMYPERQRTYSSREKVVFKDGTATAGLFACAFASVNLLLQRMIGTNHFRISTEVLNSEIATKANESGVSTSDVSIAPRKEEKVTQLLPDYSLVHFPDDMQIEGQTVCCFKLEGPQKNITGRTNEQTEGSTPRNALRESDLVTFPDYQVVDSSKALASRLNFVFAGRAEVGETSEQRSGNVNVRGDDLSSPAPHGPSTAQSATDTAFDSRQFNVSAQKSIAEALTYALECKSGMGYVWNWGDGIALQVTKKEEEDKATVRVALVRENAGDRIGHIAKLVYFSDVAMARTKDRTVEEGLQKLRQVILEGMENVRGTKRNEPDNDAPGTDGASCADGTKGQPIVKRLRREEESWTFEQDTSNTDSSTSSSVRLYPECEISLISAPCVVSKLIGTRQTLPYAFAWSAEVYKRKWKGRKVVVKVWNEDEAGGLDDLLQEMEMYEFLSENAPQVVGDVVPRFHFYWDFRGKEVCTEHKVGLVMDFVGNRVCRKDVLLNTQVIVEEENRDFVVSGPNLKALGEAVVESLDKLHKVGVIHDNVRLDNLRVERRGLKTSECGDRDEGDEMCYNWRVWWIDLGHCSFIGEDEESRFKEEKEQARRLFRYY